jgi:hypothetical protein
MAIANDGFMMSIEQDPSTVAERPHRSSVAFAQALLYTRVHRRVSQNPIWADCWVAQCCAHRMKRGKDRCYHRIAILRILSKSTIQCYWR